MAKEAGRKELAELNALLRGNPEIKASLKNIFDHWDNIHFDIPLSEKEVDQNIALVLEKIHQHINAPTPGPATSNEDQ